MLGKIFGPKRYEAIREWRRLRNEQLYDLYSSPTIRVIKSRRIGWAGHVAHVGDKRVKYRVLMGRPQERRPLGTPRWEDVTKMDLQEMEW